MAHLRRLPAAAALAAAMLLASPALADGVPVMPWNADTQNRPGLAADGAGGAWVAFKTRGDSTGLVHLAPNGLADPDWPNGIYRTGLTLQAGSTTRVLANSPDRVLVVTDFCTYDHLVMGFDANGDTATGFPASSDLFYPGTGSVLGADGRVLTAVHAALGPSSYGVRFTIVSAAGQVLTEAEVPMSVQVIGTEPSRVVPDGAGGMLIGVPIYFASDYSTGMDVAVQRIAADGTRPWTNGGKIVCASTGHQFDIRVWPDGTGGVLLTWTDARTGGSPYDVYASRFTSAGTLAAGWTNQGKRITNSAGAQMDSRVVGNGAGGAWILWRDERVADIDLYFSHVLGTGFFAAGFGLAGTLLCGATGSPTEPQMVPDGAGGFFAVWLDTRDGEADLYGTHITAAGVPAAGWPANGLALCDDPGLQGQPVLVSTGLNTAMVAWRDERTSPPRVYALGLADGGPVTTGVTPGRGGSLGLRAGRNPSFGLTDLWVLAPAGEPVELELFDVAGRAVRRATVAATGAETRARLEGEALPAGLYFATARRGAERATLRVCILR